MPRPIPPPPPQPSAEDTTSAVRLVFVLMVLFVVAFLGMTLPTHLDSPMVRYGRWDSITWNEWKASQLDEAALRAHPGGRVTWLVGSSVTRESFHAKEVNEVLAARGSAWRVEKFGIARGAAGISAGFLDRLPLRAGDRLVHHVSVGNLHRDWLSWTALPDRKITRNRSLAQLWEIGELPWQRRVEASVAWPRDWWHYRDEAMRGWTRWLMWPLPGQKWPREKKMSGAIGLSKVERLKGAPRSWVDPTAYRLYQDLPGTDLSPTQFNLQGLARMRETCERLGVELVLIDIPPTPVLQRELLTPELRLAWAAWREDNGLHYFPQLVDDDYFDLTHPNFRGREVLTRYLTAWIDDPRRGEPVHVVPLADDRADVAASRPAKAPKAASPWRADPDLGDSGGDGADEEP